MAAADVPDDLRDFVRKRAKGRCEYCQTSETVSGIRCQIDHILPRARSGTTTEDNLCLACLACNGHKQSRTHAIDPETGAQSPLYNPRRQRWSEHFTWSVDGTTLAGLTPTGRATVAALQMNDSLIVHARSLWAGLELHPPRDL